MGLRLIGGTVGLALFLLTQPAWAEPAFDHCAYMHHESKAYAACRSDDAAAEAAKRPLPATQTEPAKTVPKAKSRPRAETKS